MHIVRYLLQILSCLAICYPAITQAYPSNHDADRIEQEHSKAGVEARAPSVAGAVVIPLYREATHNTWIGYRVQPGLFGASVSDLVVRETAQMTYNAIKDQIPWSIKTVLVAVIYVPGGGWAAGTVWQGTETAFSNYGQRSPAFWSSVPGHLQGVQNWADNTHAWHAEAVAAAKLEQEFGRLVRNGKWPDGTKLFVYGKEDNGAPSAKAVCVDGHSSVKVPCKEWLERLNLSVVSLT